MTTALVCRAWQEDMERWNSVPIPEGSSGATWLETLLMRWLVSTRRFSLTCLAALDMVLDEEEGYERATSDTTSQVQACALL